jgi:uncharacterized protein (TIGR00290 family)
LIWNSGSFVKTKVVVCWSGGKDSTLALYEVQKAGSYEVTALLTTLAEEYDRVSMHGVRRELIECQAKLLGLPLEKVYLSKDSSNGAYEAKMADMLSKYRRKGVETVVFGDIFLADLRRYREENLSKAGMKAVFPLWGMDTGELAGMFVGEGFKGVVTCVDSQFLDRRYAGKFFDERFLAELPQGVDRCGENGEFHSFVYDGPIFRGSVPFRKGEIVMREKRFYYCDLLPAGD